MDSAHFWLQVQQSLAGYPADRIADLQERLTLLERQPTPAIEVMVKTLCEGTGYFEHRVGLNLKEPTLTQPFSPSQRDALGLGLSNSPLAVIAGVPGSGKTRIAKTIAHTAIQQNKQILIVSHNREALSGFTDLPNYLFQGNANQSCNDQRSEQIRRAFSHSMMDYLPLHLLPDPLLAKLRSRAELENWLPLLDTLPRPQLIQQLQTYFPDLPSSRLELLAHRLEILQPMLRQQLKLHQLYETLSEQDIAALATDHEAASPILATLADVTFSSALWQRSFDLVIVDHVCALNWAELVLLGGLAQKLVLLGTSPPRGDGESANSAPLHLLLNQLLPTYRCSLHEQFRLHPTLARPVYETLVDQWIQTQPRSIPINLAHHPSRLIWQDVPGVAPDKSYSNETEGRRILEYLQQLSIAPDAIGIVTFHAAQRDWLQEHCPPQLRSIKIGTIAEWIGQERPIVLLSCAGQAAQVAPEHIVTALTRGQDYLMIFGQVEYWRKHSPIMQSLSYHPSLHKERLALLS
jgi:AAA domain